MPKSWTFESAGRLVFGSGAIAQLGQMVGNLGIQRVLVVTDGPLVEVGLVDRIRVLLKEAQVTVDVFEGGEPEPSLDAAESCVEQAKSFGCDGIIGLGGGSNMDLAKAAAIVITHGGVIRDYLGDGKVPGPVLPLVCVPTTSGTGSEVTFASVLTDTANQLKAPILSSFIRPDLAVVDPELTLSCPRKVTADSGIDALTHAIEAYTAIDNHRFPLPAGEQSVYQGRNPLSDCLAEEAITVIGQHLVSAVNEPNNLAAREGMALGSTLAGLAFSNSGVALVHALQAAVGGATHSAHGAGNGLLLPHVMRFNLPECRPRMARITKLLGHNEVGLTEAEMAEHAIETVERLTREIGIPQRLCELGVTAEQIPALAEKSFQAKRILRVNSRTTTQQEIEDILRAAL